MGRRQQWCAACIALGSLVCTIIALVTAMIDVPANSCAMTYMWPNYLSVPVPHNEWGTRPSYTLYLYREGRGVGGADAVTGLPVLFIPGNAGSGKQVRSLGAQAHEDLADLAEGRGEQLAAELDFWAVDFDEELSALSGADLAAQAQFVCKAIAFVLSKYASSSPGVVVIGHSMGGIVARLVAGPFCHAHQLPTQGSKESNVVAVFTIAAPHTGLPAMADPLLRNLYTTGAAFWRSAFNGTTRAHSDGQTAISKLVLVSLGGGERDVLVGTDRNDVHQMCPSTHCLSVSTTALAGAWLSVDHRASLWCNQVVRITVRAIRSLSVRREESWLWELR